MEKAPFLTVESMQRVLDETKQTEFYTRRIPKESGVEWLVTLEPGDVWASGPTVEEAFLEAIRQVRARQKAAS